MSSDKEVGVTVSEGRTLQHNGRVFSAEDGVIYIDEDSALGLERIGHVTIVGVGDDDYSESLTTGDVDPSVDVDTGDDDEADGVAGDTAESASVIDTFDEKTAEMLIENGFETVDDVLKAGVDGLSSAIKGVGKARAEKILDEAKGLE